MNKTEKEKDWCGLNDHDCHQCCCNCKWHKPVHFHCTTDWEIREQLKKCICGIRKGWACCLTLDGKTRIFDKWPEHSIGCECYDPVKKIERPPKLEKKKYQRDEPGDSGDHFYGGH